jgi:hypothetical protein
MKSGIQQALKNHKYKYSKKGTKGNSATDTARASTSLSTANIATARTQREDRPRSYEDSDEETASPFQKCRCCISTTRAQREGRLRSMRIPEESELPLRDKRPRSSITLICSTSRSVPGLLYIGLEISATTGEVTKPVGREWNVHRSALITMTAKKLSMCTFCRVCLSCRTIG